MRITLSSIAKMPQPHPVSMGVAGSAASMPINDVQNQLPDALNIRANYLPAVRFGNTSTDYTPQLKEVMWPNYLMNMRVIHEPITKTRINGLGQTQNAYVESFPVATGDGMQLKAPYYVMPTQLRAITAGVGDETLFRGLELWATQDGKPA